MKTHDLQVFSLGHQYLEAPRWHAGQLWASDFFARHVIKFDDSGGFQTVARFADDSPSGLGFLPDGSLLVVMQQAKKVARVGRDGGIEEYADFAGLATGLGNDMYVGGSGHLYVGNFGFDPGSEEFRPARLVHIDPDRSVSAVPQDLVFPNGMALSPDGLLVVAETFASRIGAFTIESDGTLSDYRVWAQLDEPYRPDGIAMDADGGVWFGNTMTGNSDAGFYRVVEGGEITDKTPVGDGAWGIACTFGGPDLDVLYMTCSATSIEDYQNGRSVAYVAATRVGRTGVPPE